MPDMDQSPAADLDNVPLFTVSDLAASIKKTVEDRFGMVRLKAELSGLSRPRSGHLYFALKDENAVIDGVMWRGVASRLTFEPEDGLQVVVEGKLTTYAARSKYQLIVERMSPDGVGALMAQLERRKKQLAAEGLFDADRKKAIPLLPDHIGIITSPSGAVIRDILHRLSDRFPSRATLWPVKVQGEGSADEVTNAIRGFNSMAGDKRPDLLIVARGGGSLEDLWSFNEESVVRAVAASDIPVISAVGHETDTTLIDYAADKRAPTPTGAAEMAVPVRSDLMATVADLSRRLDLSLARGIDARRERVEALARAMPTPRDLLGLAEQRVDDLGSRLPKALSANVAASQARLNRLVGSLSLGTLKAQGARGGRDLDRLSSRLTPAMERSLSVKGDRLASASRLLQSLSYQGVLDRGFALVRDVEGAAITSAQTAPQGAAVTLTFKDGDRSAVLDGSPAPSPKKAVRKAPAKPKPGQGELF